MALDPTISLGALIQIGVILAGMLIGFGMYKQKDKSRDLEYLDLRAVVSELAREVKGLTEKITLNAVLQAQTEANTKEIGRLRDWRHDTEAALRGIQAKQQGFI